MRSKVALGGGGVLVVGLAIYQGATGDSLVPKYVYWIVLVLSIVGAQFWHGLLQFRRMNPPMRVVHPRQQFWGMEEQRGTTGIGYFFEVLNASHSESLESVKA